MIQKYKKELIHNDDYLEEYLELYDELLLELREIFEGNEFNPNL